MSQARTSITRSVLSHAILLAYTCVALAPVLVVILNSFKARMAIFNQPVAPPLPSTFSLIGYHTVFTRGTFTLNLPGGIEWTISSFVLYFGNSFIVTVASVVLVMVFGAMAAFGLSEYRYKLNTLVGLYLAIGIMIPIRLGTVAIIQITQALHIINTLWALIFVYTASGLPLSIFILSEFMRTVSDDLKNAGRIDGLSEYKIFFRLVFPLIRPALATVAVFTMIPIWNDLWFPLILAPGEATKTITLGAQSFVGEFLTDWNAVLAALSLAILPVLVLYIIFSRQLIRGITSGAVK